EPERMYRAGFERGRHGMTFYTPDRGYAENFGRDVRAVDLRPRRTLDLTGFRADADVKAADLAQLLREHGVEVEPENLFRGSGEVLQHLSQNADPAELSRRISAAGYDSVRLNEYVEGGGQSTTLAMLGEHEAEPRTAESPLFSRRQQDLELP